jgi:beta-galactosidase GanA
MGNRMLVLDEFSGHSNRWTGPLAAGEGRFPDGRVGARLSGTAECETLPSDWRGYGSLQFTVYNPRSRPAIGGIQIWDRQGKESPDREYGDIVDRGRALLFGEGITHAVIQIDPIQTQRGDRMLNLAEIVKVILKFPAPEAGEDELVITNLRLSEPKVEPDEAAQAQPGDSILYLKHLDISAYTYKPELYEDPEDVKRLYARTLAEKERLEKAVRVAEINGKQTLYARAALVVADIALYTRPMMAWHFSPAAKRRNLQGALNELVKHRENLEALLSSRRHEDDEDDSNLPISLVKPMPDLKSLRIEGRGFVDDSGTPVLVCSMSYHNEGELLQFFAPEQHKIEIYAVGGGSRYDIEWSPVYEAFHKYPNTARVGWKGWCGHLIKDQWAMGGRKENVVICLENEHILEAIHEYNVGRLDDWRHLPHLMYAILAYELTYMCYCDASIARFREWLRERHGTIEKLNECWGTAYASFDEAAPPPTEGHAPVPDANRAAWFDWADWNTRRFTDHLKWAKASVRKLHPTIPLTAGGTSSMFSPHNGTTGIDEELIINEVDDVILHEGNDLLGIDLFHALSETPKPLVDPECGGDSSRWMLNYLHGKSTISKFWWPKQPSRQFPASTMGSPAHGAMPMEAVAAHLYTALDVRRLNKEITAFWNLAKEAAILYSKTNVLQVPPELMTADTTPYLKAMRMSYDAARCLDAGVTFISEKQLRRGKASEFKLIIVPAAQYLPEDVFAALDAYVHAGGQVLVLPESLEYDEYTRSRDYLQRWGIRVERTVRPEAKGFGEWVQRYDQNLEQAVEYGKGLETEAVRFAEGFGPIPLKVSGIFQYVQAQSGDIAAAGPDGHPILLRKLLGHGIIWYVTGELAEDSLHRLLDALFDAARVERPLKVTDRSGQRVPGLEARLVRRKHDDLVYIANESGRDIDFTIQTDRAVHKIRELRSLDDYPAPEGTIRCGETLLFSLREDPTLRFRKK